MINIQEPKYMNISNLLLGGLREDNDLIGRIHQNLKPAATIDKKSIEEAMSQGLVAICIEERHYAVSKNRKVEGYYGLDQLTVWFGDLEVVSRDKLSELYNKIKAMVPAEAVKLLETYPKNQKNATYIGPPKNNNFERPEVALLLGVLFGYPVRDVRNYILEFYAAKPKLIPN